MREEFERFWRESGGNEYYFSVLNCIDKKDMDAKKELFYNAFWAGVEAENLRCLEAY